MPRGAMVYGAAYERVPEVTGAGPARRRLRPVRAGCGPAEACQSAAAVRAAMPATATSITRTSGDEPRTAAHTRMVSSARPRGMAMPASRPSTRAGPPVWRRRSWSVVRTGRQGQSRSSLRGYGAGADHQEVVSDGVCDWRPSTRGSRGIRLARTDAPVVPMLPAPTQCVAPTHSKWG